MKNRTFINCRSPIYITGCSVNPCKLGTCTDTSDGDYTCACVRGFGGKDCDTVTDTGTYMYTNNALMVFMTSRHN